jgi:hypothetical protein
VVRRASDIRDVASRWSSFSNAIPGERDQDLDFLLTTDPPAHTGERRDFLVGFGKAIDRSCARAAAGFEARIGAAVDSVSGPVDFLESVLRPLGPVVRHLGP